MRSHARQRACLDVKKVDKGFLSHLFLRFSKLHGGIVSHIGRQEERNAWMLREIQPTSADEQTSVRKRDRLDEATAKDVRHIAAAIEEDLGVERVQDAHERPPVCGECVLLDLMDEDPCQRLFRCCHCRAANQRGNNECCRILHSGLFISLRHCGVESKKDTRTGVC